MTHTWQWSPTANGKGPPDGSKGSIFKATSESTGTTSTSDTCPPDSIGIFFWRRVVPFWPDPGCKYVGMETTNRRPGRPRHRDRTPRVYVGAAMPEEKADAFDAICQAQGKSRAAVVRELVEQTIAANPQLVAGQSPGQEPLIA